MGEQLTIGMSSAEPLATRTPRWACWPLRSPGQHDAAAISKSPPTKQDVLKLLERELAKLVPGSSRTAEALGPYGHTASVGAGTSCHICGWQLTPPWHLPGGQQGPGLHPRARWGWSWVSLQRQTPKTSTNTPRLEGVDSTSLPVSPTLCFSLLAR